MTAPAGSSLTEEQIDALYAGRVRPLVFRRVRAVDRPTAIFVGAQPGAGKSSIVNRLRGRFGGNVALISSDDYRQFHPSYRQLRDTNPVVMPNVTQQFSGPAVQRALVEARDRRVNVIVEGSYRDQATTFRTMQMYADAGYRTELITVSTSVYTSQIATQQRYLNSVQEGYDARWTPRSALRRGYDESAVILTSAMAVAACHGISVVDRDAVELVSITRDPQGGWSPGDPEATCRQHREDTRPTTESFAEQVAGVAALAVSVGAVGGEYDATVEHLRQDVDELRHTETANTGPAGDESYPERIEHVVLELRSATVYERDDDADVEEETQQIFEDYRHAERNGEAERGPRQR